MQTVTTIAELRQSLKLWRKTGQSVALVPTMGNLHAGHLKLVEEARRGAERVVVSIFVNPIQFGMGEDFSVYPRTEAEDCRKLEEAQADLVFLPSVAELYRDKAKTIVTVKEISNLHCGLSRPGHFVGVATVVSKLFNLVQPDKAIFGLKDYQQCLIIRKMVEDLNFPVEIIPVPTMREPSGLAMSSRNGYLTAQELLIAPVLYQTLCHAKEAVIQKSEPFMAIEKSALNRLENIGFSPDYIAICNAQSLLPAKPEDWEIVILAAAKLGKTRLIDNIAFNVNKQ